MVGLSFEHLLRFDEQETEHWRKFLAARAPAILDSRVELAANTVREFLLHIFAVELKYAERLNGSPLTPEQLRPKTLDELFAVSASAHRNFRQYLATASDADLDQTITFPTISAGQQSASKRKVLGHALLHSMRHWAQLATEMRRRGDATNWHHDFLFSDGLK